MNTMLPFASFAECARVHPTRALHRQVIEADDCLRHLLADPAHPPRRKTPHPCVEMWRGPAGAFGLLCYRNSFVQEWLRRTLVDAPALSKIDGVYSHDHYSWRKRDPDLHRIYREHMLAKYGADPNPCFYAEVRHQPDAHFIKASADWTETPRLHRPFPFPGAR